MESSRGSLTELMRVRRRGIRAKRQRSFSNRWALARQGLVEQWEPGTNEPIEELLYSGGQLSVVRTKKRLVLLDWEGELLV